MEGPLSSMSEVNLLASLADMKEVDYKNALLLTALIDVLMEKDILSQSDLAEKIKKIDSLPTSG